MFKNWTLKKITAKWPNFLICLAIVAFSTIILFKHYRNYNNDDLISLMENKLLDLRFRARGVNTPSNKIGILAIDEKTLQRFGRWPISRKHYAKVFKNLKKLEANWIGFDVVWSSKERAMLKEAIPEIKVLKKLKKNNFKNKLSSSIDNINSLLVNSKADVSLANAIKDYEKIVLGFFYHSTKSEARALGKNKFRGLDLMLDSEIDNIILGEKQKLSDFINIKAYGLVPNNPYTAKSSENFAFFNNENKGDSIVRWVTLVRNLNNHLMPSISLKMAAQITNSEIVVFFDEYGIGISEILLINEEDEEKVIKVPVNSNGDGSILVNHYGPSKTIPHYSLVDIYDYDKLSKKQKTELKGMNLLLGPTAIAINDQRANPFDSAINGVENHAAVVDNIVNQKFMHRSQNIMTIELLIVLILGLIATPIMIFSGALFSGIFTILFLVGYYYFDKIFWFNKGEWVYVGMPFVEIILLYSSSTFYKYLKEEGEKKKVTGVFGTYLSPEVVNQVLENPESAKLGGEKKDLTVFFSDVRSFTTLSEGLSPEKLCELMNLYFNPMTNLILKSGGVLDKYIGDAIMAFWGAPISIPNQADIACKTSVDMLFALSELNVKLKEVGFPPIDIGIGLNTGSMSVGNMGSSERVQYTVMGDNVNLGARLEGQTKSYGIKLIISEGTKNALVEPKNFFIRNLDDIKVKGKSEPVTIYHLMRPDILPNVTAVNNLIGEFNQGREAYKQQDWQAAQKHFKACLLLKKDDGPSKLFLDRIEERKHIGVVDGWDGVYVATSK